MAIFDLISFSLCSKKSALLVKTAAITADQIKVNIRAGFCVKIRGHGWKFGLWFRQYSHPNPSGTLTVDYVEGFVDDHGDSGYRRWILHQRFNGNQWLRHLVSILNRDRIEMVFYDYGIEVESIFNIVKGLKISRLIMNPPPMPSAQYALEFFKRFPPLDNITVDGLPVEHMFPILFSNYQRLSFESDGYPKLDHILAINSADLETFVNMNCKHLNRFLRLWMAGSNPRLRRCKLQLFPDVEIPNPSEEMVMRGIDYQRVEGERTFPMDGVFGEAPETIRGGLDIMGGDGTKATVVLEYIEEAEGSRFKFYVWM